MWPQLVFKRFNSEWVRLSRCYQKLPPKLPLVLQGYDSKKIRCGVVLSRDNDRVSISQSAFLSTLLADVYSPDQTWFHVWKQRYEQSNSTSRILVKYGKVFGKQFERMNESELTTFNVPSEFLEKHNVEFLEVPSMEQASDDGCHFYINLQQHGVNPSGIYDWPTVNFIINPNLGKVSLPAGNQIDPEWALKAICEFINDKNTVDEYLDVMKRSNFANVKAELANKLQDVDGIFRGLQISVLENISQRENLYEKHKKLIDDKKHISGKIQRWSESAHDELQSSILPQLRTFVKNQLALWRVYSYSESKLQLKLLDMVTEPLHDLRMVNSLNRLKGELHINNVGSENFINKQEIKQKATALHKNINKIIYENFLLLQLPLILVSTFGVLSGECSSFSMGAVASFGIVLGFSRVLAVWQSLLESDVKRIRETLRSKIENEKVGLINEYQNGFATREKDFETKYEIIHSLSTSLIQKK